MARAVQFSRRRGRFAYCRMALAQEAERAADQQKSTDRGLDPSVSFRQSAVILADADQLETLARLRFEPRGTDERGLAA